MSDLSDFHRYLMADVSAAADASGVFRVEAFLERVGDLLVEAGELEAVEPCYFDGTVRSQPVRIDAHGGDPRDADGVLSLIICDLSTAAEPEILNKDDLNQLFKRARRFVESSRTSVFRDAIEETSDAYGLAHMISVTWPEVTRIKFILLTNKEKRVRGDGVTASEMDGRPVTYNIWDLSRIEKFEASGRAREDLEVDFAGAFGGAVPVLRASGDGGALASYLAVIPGSQLAAIYEKWGPRLLEANVRSFLQAKGKVNKGIRDTIKSEPGMFFAYNNGLTATAEEIGFDEEGRMRCATNLQIVNGGQTTASIHAALRTSPQSLDHVFVQMKVNVVPPTLSEEVVPRISEFANSQNKVSAADFFSNHPFHIRMEQLSRSILAPAGEGYLETRWFYERARGQFAEARLKLTEAARRKFDLAHPKANQITKTDMAKFEMTWRRHPDIVSHGAQKTFTGPRASQKGFAQLIGEEWRTSEARFDELWFRRLVAKAIIFRSLERLVPGQEWFLGGYRANIVTYAIAKLAEDVDARGMAIDLDAVWRLQAVPRVLEDALVIAAIEAQDVITNPPSGLRNMSEWAKRPACWATLKERELDYGPDLEDVLITVEDARAEVRTGRRSKAVTDGIEVQTAVIQAGSAFWSDVRAWGGSKRLLSETEASVLDVCSRIPSRLPSEKQCAVAKRALSKLRAAGYENPTAMDI